RAASARDAFPGLCVEEMELVARDREVDVLAVLDVRVSSYLRSDGSAVQVQVNELLVAEVLDDLDARPRVQTVAARVSEPDVLGPEARDHPGAARADERRRHQVHRGRADEA